MVKKEKKDKNKKDKEFEEYKNTFKSEDDRVGHSITMVITMVVGIYYMFHMNKFMDLWYSPYNPTWRNIFNFVTLISCCWVFGYFFSKSIAFGRKFGRTYLKKK